MDIVQILSSAVASSVLLASLGWLFRGLIGERLSAAVKHEYEEKIAKLRSQLQRENQETSSRFQKDLDVLREKELGGHKDKIQAYRLVIDVMASLYSDIQHAVRTQVFEQAIIDRYNQAWVQCYGYLSMLAPQDVMDAYDRLNDYILNILNGRSSLQEWAVTRTHALAFLNAVRSDVGLSGAPVEYHGNL